MKKMFLKFSEQESGTGTEEGLYRLAEWITRWVLGNHKPQAPKRRRHLGDFMHPSENNVENLELLTMIIV